MSGGPAAQTSKTGGTTDATPLGIIAGGGILPLEIADTVARTGRKVFIAGIEGTADAGIAQWPHATFHLGALGSLFDMLRKAGCVDLVIAGRADRPDIASLRLDGKAIRSLPRILSMMIGGDDTVLSGVIRFIEDHGFRVVGAHEAAPSLVCGEALVGRRSLSKAEKADIETGFEALRRIGPLDIGQAVAVIGRRIVAVEAAEGTDAMIRRVGELRRTGRITGKAKTGVLVKAPKPHQDLRVDMPTIGPDTVDLAAEAGLAGIGVAASGVLIAQRAETESRIRQHGLFLAGQPDK
ncbi:MAG: UDP-2,3-diacylglucosamine diphosphatase LpxI [Rhodobiaceae bacterium]|nr:UDP-2,3-diacylglucosamine diphosphatase LpxI [Rhodobiaceae bacterium]